MTGVLRSQYGKEFMDKLNAFRNWLKHAEEPQKFCVYELDAVNSLLRAISKFFSLYSTRSEAMADFDFW